MPRRSPSLGNRFRSACCRKSKCFSATCPITKYETPGGQEFADTIIPFVKKTNIIVLANHGTVSYGENVERAYWWTEILDAYCRILMLARGLGNVAYFSRRPGTRTAGAEGQVGFRRSAQHARVQELRHLRQRHLPRQLEGKRRRAAGLPATRPVRRHRWPGRPGGPGSAHPDDHRPRDRRTAQTIGETGIFTVHVATGARPAAALTRWNGESASWTSAAIC